MHPCVTYFALCFARCRTYSVACNRSFSACWSDSDARTRPRLWPAAARRRRVFCGRGRRGGDGGEAGGSGHGVTPTGRCRVRRSESRASQLALSRVESALRHRDDRLRFLKGNLSDEASARPLARPSLSPPALLDVLSWPPRRLLRGRVEQCPGRVNRHRFRDVIGLHVRKSFHEAEIALRYVTRAVVPA